MIINANIRSHRKRVGMTQYELAKRIGVDQSTISQWEKGIASPRMGKVEKLASVFGIPVSELLLTYDVTDYTAQNSDERELLDAYRSMSSDGKKLLLEDMRAIRGIDSRIGTNL